MQCPNCQFENMPGSEICPRCGSTLRLSAAVMSLHPPRAQPWAKAVRRAFPFGRAYYAGFVDANDTFSPIDLRSGGALVASDPALGLAAMPASAGARAPSRAPTIVWAASASLGVAAGVFGVMALDARSSYDSAMAERPLTEAQHRYATFGWLSAGTAAVAVAGAIVGYVLSRR